MRWWADPAAARTMLEVIDDSDVVQGVASAALGYHALAAEVLVPLAKATLVDRALVGQALATVDLEPVCKALAVATRPVMGEAADRYGALLAASIHEDASAATGQLLASWTQGGLSWPAAVERAAEVHGVPSRALGAYAHAMRSPVVAPVAREDAADRELMRWAAGLGRREATPVETLSTPVDKADRVFSENEVRRDEDGRFTSKGTGLIDPRALRRQRRLRRVERGVKGEAFKEKRAAAERSARESARSESKLSGLASLLRKPEQRKVAQRSVAQRTFAGRSVEQRRAIVAAVAAHEQAVDVKKLPGKQRTRLDDTSFAQKHAGTDAHRWNDGSAYVLVSRNQAAEIANSPVISVGAFNDRFSTEMRAHSADSMDTMLRALVSDDGVDLADLVILRMDQGVFVSDEDPEQPDGGAVSSVTVMTPFLQPEHSDLAANAFLDSFDLVSEEDEVSQGQVSVPIMVMNEMHVDEFNYVRSIKAHQEATGGLDVFRKAWDEAEVARDDSGRFAQETAAPKDPRAGRRQRRLRRAQRARVAPAVVVEEREARPVEARRVPLREVGGRSAAQRSVAGRALAGRAVADRRSVESKRNEQRLARQRLFREQKPAQGPVIGPLQPGSRGGALRPVEAHRARVARELQLDNDEQEFEDLKNDLRDLPAAEMDRLWRSAGDRWEEGQMSQEDALREVASLLNREGAVRHIDRQAAAVKAKQAQWGSPSRSRSRSYEL